MARVVKRDRHRLIDWGAVAIVRRDLQSIINAYGAETQWLNEPEEGGWLRELELELATGGLAYLDEHRQYPGEFTIYLQRHRDMFFFKEDYAEVLAFLGLEPTCVTLLTGQVRWWKKNRPTGSGVAGALGGKQLRPRRNGDA